MTGRGQAPAQASWDDDVLEACSDLVRGICAIAGNTAFVDELRDGLEQAGVVAAVADHDDGPIFDWLIEAFSFQGIADAIAIGYIEDNGQASAAWLDRSLAARPSCPKLRSYWHFDGCRYHKGSGTCAEPEHVDHCPLPRLPLRNGRLNQTAYSLRLFMRDAAGGDFTGWLDRRLEVTGGEAQQGIIEPLRHVFGVSDKVLSMALSGLLLAADGNRQRWVAAGAGMIAIDTLVHNWLHRTGILDRLGARHLYGQACYGPRGCAAIVRQVASRIDASSFNPAFPPRFPRFVQNAVWRFCSQAGLDRCNGNRIDDADRCQDKTCPVHARCGRVALR